MHMFCIRTRFNCCRVFVFFLDYRACTNPLIHLFSSVGKDGFQSADSMTSQQTSVSVGDDSTGSWSNLSFEDEHQDESSSFLHLSDRYIECTRCI